MPQKTGTLSASHALKDKHVPNPNTAMQTHVILLRGVTPTGKNKVPMAALRLALEEAGLSEVRSYIQSGNVVARSALDRARLERLVHESIAEKIGADIAVMARTAEEFARILARNPFAGAETARVYFSLLSALPEPARLQAFEAIDFAPELMQRVGDVIYTLYATQYSDSRFTHSFLERKLKVAVTTRNFNTMSRLLALSGASDPAM